MGIGKLPLFDLSVKLHPYRPIRKKKQIWRVISDFICCWAPKFISSYTKLYLCAVIYGMILQSDEQKPLDFCPGANFAKQLYMY
jgi:hypothetical protein